MSTCPARTAIDQHPNGLRALLNEISVSFGSIYTCHASCSVHTFTLSRVPCPRMGSRPKCVGILRSPKQRRPQLRRFHLHEMANGVWHMVRVKYTVIFESGPRFRGAFLINYENTRGTLSPYRRPPLNMRVERHTSRARTTVRNFKYDGIIPRTITVNFLELSAEWNTVRAWNGNCIIQGNLNEAAACVTNSLTARESYTLIARWDTS